ncbi:S2-RNase [Pyrus ussuriensis x Pyrus communis]|uniref:S2-RNase n=1 Tax=Pyrus ussuriensis x Pyrus communis TaxID=2448454 RepID=A0A5N5FHG6_9ROSA|nr:S2-RNase [Pyrus ussuriensis x Pyrus communis]
MVNFAHEVGRCLKLPGVDLSSTVVQRGQGWLGFAPRRMGYKAQVVASAIALPICRKIKKGGRSTVRTVNFRGLKPLHNVVNQGGSWMGFVEGNERFKMVVVASKNSTGVGQNRPWKMGYREWKNQRESWDGLDAVGGGFTSKYGRLERLAQPYGVDVARGTSNTTSEVTKYRRKQRKIAAQGICMC